MTDQPKKIVEKGQRVVARLQGQDRKATVESIVDDVEIVVRLDSGDLATVDLRDLVLSVDPLAKKEFIVERPPALDIDAEVARVKKSVMAKLTAQQVLERRIAWNLLGHLFREGFDVTGVASSGEDAEPAKDAKAAMELIFNLDEAVVYFKNRQGKTRYVLLVLGNGEDLISDWGVPADPSDGFNHAMEDFLDRGVEACY